MIDRLPPGLIRPHRRRDDRGAVVPFVGVLLSVVLLIAALAVDLGMERVGRSDMQSLADVVALDLARDLDGSTAAALSPTMQAKANQSRDRNDRTVGDEPVVVPELGELDSTGAFRAVSGSAVPTAVRVTASTDVAYAFGGITNLASGAVTRSAVATADQGACFRIGSFVAQLDTQESALLNPILGGMLGSTVNLDAVSYNGLAAADATLADLVSVGGLGVGAVDELLALQNVSVGTLFIAMADVLDREGQGSQASILRTLSVSAATPKIAIADLISASGSDEAALDADLKVLDLVTAAAFLANKNHAVSIPNLGITLPGVGTVGASLNVIESPRMACGRPGVRAWTAQVQLTVTATIPAQTINVAGVGSVSVRATTVTLAANLGQAQGELVSVNGCPPAATGITVAASSSVVGDVDLTASLGISASVSVNPLGGGNLLQAILQFLGLGSLLRTPTISIDTNLAVAAGSTASGGFATNVTVPIPSGYTTPVGTGSGDLLSGLTVTTQAGATIRLRVPKLLSGWDDYTIATGANLFNAFVNPILNTLTSSILTPLVDAAQTRIVDPLAGLLGLQLGGADVFAVPTPVCTAPRLRE